MGVSLSATTRGIPAAMARNVQRHEALLDAMYDATAEGVDLAVEQIRFFTPVMAVNRGGSHRYPGELAGSVQGEVQIMETGRVVGKVWTDIPWGPFVEHGTLEHGPARHMFQLGMRTARPLISMLFQSHIGRAVD